MRYLLLFLIYMSTFSYSMDKVARAARAILFDFDGTIVNTRKLLSKHATCALLQRRGIAASNKQLEELCRRSAGNSGLANNALLKKMFDLPESPQELKREKSALARQLYGTHLEFNPGFERFHRALVQRRMLTGIVTNNDSASMRRAELKLELRKKFGKHIYDRSCVEKGKPDPALYLYALHAMHLDPAQTIAIEDSIYGVESARGAGIAYVIGIAADGQEEKLLAVDVDFVIKQFNHLRIDSYFDVHVPCGR